MCQTKSFRMLLPAAAAAALLLLATSTSARKVDDIHIVDKNKLQEASDVASMASSLHGDEINHMTIEDLEKADHNLDHWVPPYNFSHRFVLYQAGYDYERRPIWVAELGKWDLRSAVDADEEQAKAFEKYFSALAIKVLYSIRNSSTPEHPVNDMAVIVDYDGLKIEQFLSISTMRFFLRLTREYANIINEHVGDIILINMNAVAHVALDLTRPFFTVLEDRLELYGTNKERWIPAIRSKFPIESIPTWYGGKKDFKPVKIYG